MFIILNLLSNKTNSEKNPERVIKKTALKGDKFFACDVHN